MSRAWRSAATRTRAPLLLAGERRPGTGLSAAAAGARCAGRRSRQPCARPGAGSRPRRRPEPGSRPGPLHPAALVRMPPDDQSLERGSLNPHRTGDRSRSSISSFHRPATPPRRRRAITHVSAAQDRTTVTVPTTTEDRDSRAETRPSICSHLYGIIRSTTFSRARVLLPRDDPPCDQPARQPPDLALRVDRQLRVLLPPVLRRTAPVLGCGGPRRPAVPHAERVHLAADAAEARLPWAAPAPGNPMLQPLAVSAASTRRRRMGPGRRAAQDGVPRPRRRQAIVALVFQRARRRRSEVAALRLGRRRVH